MVVEEEEKQENHSGKREFISELSTTLSSMEALLL